MSMGRRVVEEYSQLLARAFNGAITVNGQRIVAHPSGTLIVRGGEPRPVVAVSRPLDRDSAPPFGAAARSGEAGPCDRENDWSDV
jgi:hypothetical protein